MGMYLELPISRKILTVVAKLDHFQGLFSSQRFISAERMRRIEEAVRILSVGASSRLAGISVSDSEVAGLLGGGSVALRGSK